MTGRKIGELLDSLGVTAEIEDTDLVSSACVLLNVMPSETDAVPTLIIATSEGMGWIEQAGLLRAAERIATAPTRGD